MHTNVTRKTIHLIIIMIKVDIQHATTSPEIPENQQIRKWVKTTLSAVNKKNRELTVRIIDEEECSDLNEQWRKRTGPTNVLSFPAGNVEQFTPGFIGDIILCAPVINREAVEQKKQRDSHWAHMIVHGTLHLLGYDHLKAEEAEKMELLEIRILESMGIKNPYQLNETI